jgi:hypothetical protein
MLRAHWFTQHEHGGFRIERAALPPYDLSVVHAGGGEWQCLMRQTGGDVAEGKAQSAVEAPQAAEAVAIKLG